MEGEARLASQSLKKGYCVIYLNGEGTFCLSSALEDERKSRGAVAVAQQFLGCFT